MSDDKKNIIKINRKELSSVEIAEKENFEGLVSHHHLITKRPIYKRKRFYFILFLILVISYLLYQVEKKEPTKDQKGKVTNKK